MKPNGDSAKTADNLGETDMMLMDVFRTFEVGSTELFALFMSIPLVALCSYILYREHF